MSQYEFVCEMGGLVPFCSEDIVPGDTFDFFDSDEVEEEDKNAG